MAQESRTNVQLGEAIFVREWIRLSIRDRHSIYYLSAIFGRIAYNFARHFKERIILQRCPFRFSDSSPCLASFPVSCVTFQPFAVSINFPFSPNVVFNLVSAPILHRIVWKMLIDKVWNIEFCWMVQIVWILISSIKVCE